jgi:RHS repeat-associated protein
MTDEEGNLAWQAQYKAWGEAILVVEKMRNPLRFQGQYFDHETGLHYNRFRYYDPETGRFISKDPIGFVGGINCFQYGENPVGWIDPFGLKGRKKLDVNKSYETHAGNHAQRNQNDRMPQNSCFAGKVMRGDDLPRDVRGKYPHGVPFSMFGYPDFSRYAKTTVNIGSFSSDTADFKKADEIATSRGVTIDKRKYVWHHDQKNGILLLVPRDIHDAVKHTGGASICGTRRR